MSGGSARIVLVTGASRGVGAEVARRFADPDTHVLVHYRQNVARANDVADAIRAAGGQASTLAADICDEAGVVALMASVKARFGRLDALVLNASGALTGADPHAAMRLNGDAQRRLAQLAVTLMPAGGRIVFVTSHQAHFFPHKAVPKGLVSVAAGQRAGETALYRMRSMLARAGVHLTVVSADMIEGGHLPGVTEFADAIVGATSAANSPSIVYAGRADFLQTA